MYMLFCDATAVCCIVVLVLCSTDVAVLYPGALLEVEPGVQGKVRVIVPTLQCVTQHSVHTICANYCVFIQFVRTPPLPTVFASKPFSLYGNLSAPNGT